MYYYYFVTTDFENVEEIIETELKIHFQMNTKILEF